MRQPTMQKLVSTINGFVKASDQPVSWKQIMERVQEPDVGFTVNPVVGRTWMEVRHALQYAIDNDLILRVKSVHVEEYVCVKSLSGGHV